ILALVQPLLPKHSPLNVARFISVDTISQVPLSEYPQRSAVFKLQSAGLHQGHGPRLVAAVLGQSSPQSIQGAATTTPSPADTAPTPSPADTAPTPSPADTAPTPSPADTAPTSSVPVSPAIGTASPTCATSPSEMASPAC